MKKSLLATVAAVALIAGTGMVSAAEGAKDHPAAKAGGQAAGQVEMNKAPDVKAGADVKGKAQTTGSGAEMKADTKTSPAAKPSTTGAGAADTKADMKSKSPTDTKSSADTKAKSSTTGANETKSGSDSKAAADTKSNAGASASLTTEQKTKIRTTVIESKSAPKVQRSSINFNIRIGTVVPRTVHYVAVPPTLVEIHPTWRGHMYFVVDDEIIIVDSRGRIVAIVDV